MLGVLLATISAFFDEAATDIGKLKVKRQEISIYTMGLINCVIATAVLTIFLALDPPTRSRASQRNSRIYDLMII